MCRDEVEVANEDENVDYATTRDQDNRKQEEKLNGNMEAYPENYPTDRLCCGGAEDGYKENLILESEEEDEEGVGEN
ncbi:hypothetical protein E5676_scaffold1545G00150 [Cucumis melo var. makuwa]|uniref:Uncharacterized protein n=1 Tax=Cucumis melo var. makuwa TaxID=1194695 RepID=A0A5A7UCL3_CUCMM|nr:hypothetical protein E6C27_scaffold135G00140 [Cucumis melo var. makuwa]TYK00814.1 hypothetical protein E5676_scaffold1545G00150 [Cucumis melo var. makuwa]